MLHSLLILDEYTNKVQVFPPPPWIIMANSGVNMSVATLETPGKYTMASKVALQKKTAIWTASVQKASLIYNFFFSK